MWVGKCLPTEEEWEFAARGDLRGMFDMLGNAWEWTSTRYFERVVDRKLQKLKYVLKGGSSKDTRDGWVSHRPTLSIMLVSGVRPALHIWKRNKRNKVNACAKKETGTSNPSQTRHV